MNTGKVILGALAGLAVGAVAGILFAPEKGSTTRKQVMDKGEDKLDKLKSKFNLLRDSLTEKFKSAEKDAKGFVDKVEAKYGDEKKAVKNAAYEKIEKDLNSKILKITMMINDQHPELSQYLDEMPVTVPSEDDPEMNINHLESYYESLISILEKYKVDYPKVEE